MADTKRCSRCKTEKPLTEFTTQSRNRDGRYSYCFSCEALRHREAYKKNPSGFKLNVKKWEGKNIEKKVAHSAVHQAVKNGIIVRPSICEICKKENNNIVAHHWHGYDEHHRLDVQWVCRQCHKKTV